MLQTIKNTFRRWQLGRQGVVQQRKLKTFTAGDRSGLWTVCPDLLHCDSLVYSFGVGDNLAWDLELVTRFGLTIHTFDPTPASVAWVARQTLPTRLQFHPTGLADHDGTQKFSPRRPASRFNFRPLLDGASTGATIVEAPVRRLTTHMKTLGHKSLDVLKMDIEGGEYAAIDDLIASRIPVKQLLVEFHHHFPDVGIERTVRAVKVLDDAGYKIFHLSDRGLEMSFMHAPIGDC